MHREENKVIIFSEPGGQERVLPAATQEELALSCLLVLRERYLNEAWGYQPKNYNATDEELDFIQYWEREANQLPELLYKQGERLYERLKANLKAEDDPDWIWYRSVQKLLSLSPDIAKRYRIGYGGRVMPTAYYLLLKRKHYPNEDFVIAELQN